MEQHLQEILNLTNATKLSNGGYIGHCPTHKDANKSLSITPQPNKLNPLVKCHSGCTNQEIIDFFKSKNLWVNEVYLNKQKEMSLALIAWKNALPLTKDCIGSLYLKSRGLDFKEKFPSSIRFIEKATYTSVSGEKYELPCLIFKIQNKKGDFLGVQRIFLNEYGEKYKSDYPEDSAKKVLGTLKSGFVVFEGKEDSNDVHIAEGPETSLAIFLSTRETTYCMINANNLIHAPTEDTSKTYHLWADKDKSKTGEIQARKAGHLIASKGIECRLHLPELELALNQKSIDFLDVYNQPKGKDIIIDESLSGETVIDYPLKLESPSYDLPEVDESFLPNDLYKWAKVHSERLQVSKEEVVIPFLFSVGSALSPRFRIKTKKEDSWVIVPNLWCMLVAPPGSKKSAVLDLSLKTLYEIETEIHEETLNAQNEVATDIQLLNSRITKLQKDYNKVKDASKKEEIQKEVKKIYNEIKKMKPESYRLAMQTATIEKIIDVLSEGTESLALMFDELTSLISVFNKVGHETDRAFYLKAWNGDSFHSYDTKSGGTKYIQLLCLSIAGGTQPSVLKSIVHQAESMSMNDGFIQRFQLATYSNQRKDKKFVDIGAPQELDKKLKQLIREIFNERKKFAKEQKAKQAFKKIELSDVAYIKSITLQNKIFYYERMNHDNELFVSHICKYPSLFGSLVLIFHAIECKLLGNEIDQVANEKSVGYAIKWIELLYEHAKKIYGVEENVNFSAMLLANKIKNGQLKSGMSLFDIARKEWKGLKTKSDIEKGIQVLIEHNWLKLEHKKSSEMGGKPKIEVVLHPQIDEFIEALDKTEELYEN